MRIRPKPASLHVIVALSAAMLAAFAIHPSRPLATPLPKSGLGLIQHIVIIMQENRSFDHYFGVYHGTNGQRVDGFPRNPNGSIAVCVPDPVLGHCVKPYHTANPALMMQGGPHGVPATVTDVNGGKMNGFVQAAIDNPHGKNCAALPFSAGCSRFEGPQHQPDVMSYLTRKDIPNYWQYADWGVLQDHMFESVDSHSLPSHLYLWSGWSATCTDPYKAMTCSSTGAPRLPEFPWTDISWLLNQNGISWDYYVGDGTNICGQWPNCAPLDKATATPAKWDPVPGFLDVQQAGQTISHVQHTSDLISAAGAGTLPQVSWVMPGGGQSEHPKASTVGAGQSYVTDVVNAIGQSPEWDSTAVFISWDDWGGFYDNVRPPRVDNMGYGIRVPGLVISPYAKQGYVDHQILSGDAYLKFIEDVFLGGQRLNPKTDNRPDSRPTVRENAAILGTLANDFDFTQAPRPAPIIP